MITICSSPARAALKGGATLSVQFMDTTLAIEGLNGGLEPRIEEPVHRGKL